MGGGRVSRRFGGGRRLYWRASPEVLSAGRAVSGVDLRVDGRAAGRFGEELWCDGLQISFRSCQHELGPGCHRDTGTPSHRARDRILRQHKRVADREAARRVDGSR